MLRKVNTVLIGNYYSGSDVVSMTEGEIALFNENNEVIQSSPGLQNITKVRFGRCESIMDVAQPDGTITQMPKIRYSQWIDRKHILTPNPKVITYEAPVEQIVTFSGISSMTVEADVRYGIRIVYKDLSQFKYQITKTYDYLAKEGDTGAEVMAGLVAKINKDKNRRIQSDDSLTLTALVVNDNEGLDSINEYSQVSFEVYPFQVKMNNYLHNEPKPMSGVTVETIQTPNPGQGNPKIVRDREKWSLGYRGVTNTIQFPYNKPSSTVNLSEQYDTFVLEWELPYRSPDNQYIKSTPLAVELYASSGSIPTSLVEAIKL